MQQGVRRQVTAAAGFALLALLAEVTGRELTNRLDGALNVEPFATPTTRYYPFLLAGVRAIAALVVAAAVWRVCRAHASAAAGERLLGNRRPAPASARAPLAAPLACVLLRDRALVPRPDRRRPPLPWPLAAVCAVAAHLRAAGLRRLLDRARARLGRAVRDWLADVEKYAAATFARASRMLRAAALPPHARLVGDDRAPRRLFGLAFESRPPPLPA